MVKRVETLPRIEAEAGVRYEDTRLAQRARPARQRLGWLLLAGAAGLAIEAFLSAQPGWLLGTLLVALTAWSVRASRLVGVLGAALTAVLAVSIPLALVAAGARDLEALLTAGVAVTWGVAMLPDVILLVRDQELQHAFGLWARRDERD